MRFFAGDYQNLESSEGTLWVEVRKAEEGSEATLILNESNPRLTIVFDDENLDDLSWFITSLEDVDKVIKLASLRRVLFSFVTGKELFRKLLTLAVESFTLHFSEDLRFKSREKGRQHELEFYFQTGNSEGSADYQAMADAVSARTQGVITTRRLGNIPPNLLYPEKLAEEANILAKAHGFSCEVIDAQGLEHLGMNAHLAVGAGSERPPCLIIIDTKPGSDETPIALIGKGLTFDSGGISIKPAADMHKMKVDMGGAGAVLGIIDILGRMPIDKRVVAVIGAAENMPDGKSYRPGDIIKTHKGITVEVLNTDAEGRMVLADALSYTASRYAPELMIDLATLTGAMKVALGDKIVGMFGTDDNICHNLMEIGKDVSEPVWQMPLMPHFYELIKSQVADIANVGGRFGGACTAAMFLKQFTGDIPWVHLDLAGAWGSKSFTQPQEGASGMGVRVVAEFLLRNYQN